MIDDLFTAARSRLNIETNAELGRRLGVQRAFMCNIKAGRKPLPYAMKVKLAVLCDWLVGDVDDLINKGTDHDALPAVPDLQRSAEHESGVLPGAASGVPASAAPQPVPAGGKAAAGQGRGQPADLLGELGEVPSPRVQRTGRVQRGTRSGTVLIVGRTYYPDKSSDHTHRRVLGLIRKEGEKTVVVYSIGGDHTLACTRDTFIRWMDPTRYHNGQTEVRLAEAGPAKDQPAEPKAKRVRKARAAEANAA